MDEIKNEYISMAAVKARSWTGRAIAQFLGPHDKSVPNPRCKSAAPAKLYLLSRVEEAEQSDTYRAFVAANAARVAGARRAVETKKAGLLAEVESWPIAVPSLPFEQVQRNAIRSSNDYHEPLAWKRGYDFDPARRDSDPDFLDRITVNYLRHNLSEHDEKIVALFGKTGKHEAYVILNRKIHEAIAATFPEIRDECDRKIRLKSGEPERFFTSPRPIPFCLPTRRSGTDERRR